MLADTGYVDVAYELLFTDTTPSWLYVIDRGATTVWERWNAFWQQFEGGSSPERVDVDPGQLT